VTRGLSFIITFYFFASFTYWLFLLSSGRTGLIAATRLRPALYATTFLNFKIGPALANAAYLPADKQVRLWVTFLIRVWNPKLHLINNFSYPKWNLFCRSY
jgi:hypothetical protein